MVARAGTVRAENEAAGGWQINPSVYLGYVQEFHIRPGDPVGSFIAYDGYVKNIVRLWQNTQSSGELEFRAFLPTNWVERQAGFITGLRSSFKITFPLATQFDFSMAEVHIVYVYDRPGVHRSDTTLLNRMFENRVYLTLAGHFLGDALRVSFPLVIEGHQHHGLAPGVSGKTDYRVWVYPEVTYAISSSMAVGMAFYSESLVAEDSARWALGPALEQGVVQAIFQYVL